MAKTRECCSALSLRRTGDDLHVSLHKGFKIRLAGIVPVSLEFTAHTTLESVRAASEVRGWFVRAASEVRPLVRGWFVPIEANTGSVYHFLISYLA